MNLPFNYYRCIVFTYETNWRSKQKQPLGNKTLSVVENILRVLKLHYVQTVKGLYNATEEGEEREGKRKGER